MDENNILYEEKKEKVLEFINSKDYFPMGLKDIEVIMQVPHEDREIFSNIIEDLEKEGKIIKSKKGKIMKPEELKLYVGQLTGNSRGFGFVKVDGLEEDIFIPANAMNNAMHKDTVMVKLNPSSRGKRQEGEVVKIIKRGMDGIVGTYQSVKGYGFVIPDDKKIADDIFISSGDSMGAVTGHNPLRFGKYQTILSIPLFDYFYDFAPLVFFPLELGLSLTITVSLCMALFIALAGIKMSSSRPSTFTKPKPRLFPVSCPTYNFSSSGFIILPFLDFIILPSFSKSSIILEKISLSS